MAGQAGTAGVGITRHTLVFGVGVGLIVFVTVDAADDGEVAGIGMTGGAGIPGTLVGAGVDGEVLGIVIEGCRPPSGFRMAGGTVGGETGGCMGWIQGLLIVGLVASYTGIGGVVKVFVVTTGTVVGDSGMGSIECKEIVVVGHGCWCPARFSGVAAGTVGAQTDLLVVGVGGLVEVVLVAAHTFGGRAGVAVGMAGEALQREVGSRQGKVGLVMVEDLLFLSRGMAGQTRRGRIGITGYRLMVLIGDGLIVLVALDAAEGRKVVLLDVAGGAGIPGAGMGAGVDRKILPIVVAEIGWFPAHLRGVTALAVGRESSLQVVGVDRSLKVLLVAGDARRRYVGIVVADMAAGTVLDGVAVGQRKEIVVKAIRDPGKSIHIVALRTVGRETRLRVVRPGRGLKVLLMAGDACRVDGVEA